MASWEWRSLDSWVQYEFKPNKKIAKASLKGKPSVEIQSSNGVYYIIDLVNLRQYQKNNMSKARKIRYNDGSLPRVIPKIGAFKWLNFT